MELNRVGWTQQDYDQLLKELFLLQDVDYRTFQKRIIPTELEMIGVRAPLLKKMAGEIAKGDVASYFQMITYQYYEEFLLQGIVIGKYKADFLTTCALLRDFIPKVENWAVCDMTCSSLKSFQKVKNQAEGFAFAVSLLKEENPWTKRFGLVLLLDYFINDMYIEEVIIHSVNIACSDYYVQMANGWLLSIAFIKFPKQTAPHLRYGKIDEKIRQIALQKILDSKRVPLQTKERIREWKRERM